MLLNEEELTSRLESPLNLLNRLKNLTNPHKKNIIPALPPTADELIKDIDDKLANKGTETTANRVMNSALAELEKRLPEVSKPEKLAAIAHDMSKIVSNTKVKEEGGIKIGQIVIYSPQVMREEEFNVIDVGAD
jgi:cation transport regulator ChaB